MGSNCFKFWMAKNNFQNLVKYTMEHRKVCQQVQKIGHHWNINEE